MANLLLVSENVVRSQFIRDAPEALRFAIVEGVIEAYSQAENSCRRYDRGTRLDLLPIVRRANIEQAMKELPGVPGFSFLSAQNRSNSKGSAHHVVLRSGGFGFTFSKTDSIDELPRNSEFRNDYATSLQLPLFSLLGEPEDESIANGEPDENDLKYTIVCHGPGEQGRDEPAYIMARFMSTSITNSEIDPPFDLLGEYRSRRDITQPEVALASPVKPTLKIVEKVGNQTS